MRIMEDGMINTAKDEGFPEPACNAEGTWASRDTAPDARAPVWRCISGHTCGESIF